MWYKHTEIRETSRHGRKDGGTCPPTFFQVGDTISNVPPPPHVLGVGWILVDIMYFFACFFSFFWPSSLFFLFFFCLSEMFVMWVGYPYTFWLARLSTQMALRKNVSVPPPPPPPPTIRFGFAPLPVGLRYLSDVMWIIDIIISLIREIE